MDKHRHLSETAGPFPASRQHSTPAAPGPPQGPHSSHDPHPATTPRDPSRGPRGPIPGTPGLTAGTPLPTSGVPTSTRPVLLPKDRAACMTAAFADGGLQTSRRLHGAVHPTRALGDNRHIAEFAREHGLDLFLDTTSRLQFHSGICFIH